MIQTKQHSHRQYGNQTRQHTRNESCQYCTQIVAQQLQLLIQRNRQANCRRRQQIAQKMRTGLIALIINVKYRKKYDDDHNRYKKRIKNCQLPFLFQEHTDLISQYAHHHSKKYGIT